VDVHVLSVSSLCSVIHVLCNNNKNFNALNLEEKLQVGTGAVEMADTTRPLCAIGFVFFSLSSTDSHS